MQRLQIAHTCDGVDGIVDAGLANQIRTEHVEEPGEDADASKKWQHENIILYEQN